MTGFLQRLATQAMGQAYTVRSTARLPFASNLLAIQPLEQAESVDEWSAMPVQKKDYTNFTTENSKQLNVEKATSSFSEKTAAQSDPQFTSIPVENLNQSEHLDFQFPPKEMSQREFPSPILGNKVENSIVIENLVPISIAQGQQPPNFIESDLPSPLIPVKRTVGSVAANVHAFSQRDELNGGKTARENLNEETTEVHVTIGRIEVTAVHAPSPLKPASKPERQTLSLDEYLAKRNRN